MSDRPTPEEMLVRAAEEEARKKRGRLKVFFGAAPGVGKTYAMLEAGAERRADGVDVLIGWVETHRRAETEALAGTLERLPPRVSAYRGIEVREFDLEAALARRPGLLLVDELPHTNAEGSRHRKRWQDVEELVEAGIDVYTTLNVQHLESLNDVVAQITGVTVRETVPDALFQKADEIEVIDLPPDDLLKRLEEGKVYIGDAAGRAADNFFQKGNLIALRELALRRSAERVDAQVDAWRKEHGIAEPWNTGERLLVAVGPAPHARDLVRVTYRMATRLHAPWLAVSVENLGSDALPAEARDRAYATLAFAEQLGAETLTLRGESVADEIVKLARARNVSRIVLGRPTHPRWRDRLRGSLVEALIRKADGIDVLVTSGEPESTRPAPPPQPRPAPMSEWLEACLWVAGASLLGVTLRPFLDVPDFAMLHLLAVVLAATRVGARPSLFAAVASVAMFDFLFVPPFLTLRVSDFRYWLTFGVMLTVGVIVSRLTVRIRDQARSATHREQRTAALYALSGAFAQEVDPVAIAHIAVRHIRDHLGCDSVLWVDDHGALRVLGGETDPMATNEREVAIGRWVLEHGRAAGRGTDTLPSGQALHLPLPGSQRTIGVLALRLADADDASSEKRQLADAFARQAALALERAILADQAERSRVAVETEQQRNALLSAVSHDLRTPLASITGSATAMLDNPALSPEARRDLLETIREEGDHLGRLVADLLDLTRIESGGVRAHREWGPVEEVIDSALSRTETQLAGRTVNVRLPDEVLTAPMDATLIGQVLVNLLENAARHTPPGSQIDVVALRTPTAARIEVQDRGPGVPESERERIFEKFYRTADGQRRHGTGLGLAICRAILRAHGGTITVTAREGGGSVFAFELPLDATGEAP